MKRFLMSVADALDILAILAAVGAALFFLTNLGSIDTGPEFMQVALFTLLVAIIPYCLAGAAHRICQRL